MIPRIFIKRELTQLNKLYQSSSSIKGSFFPKLYSKLAVLELCGWTEECMDNLINAHIRRKRLKQKDNIDFIQSITIGRTFGFRYKEHFRKMLIETIGIIEVEYIERKMNQYKKGSLESALTKLWPERSSHAHSTIRATNTFTAPSVCLLLYNDIGIGLMEYEKWLRKL